MFTADQAVTVTLRIPATAEAVARYRSRGYRVAVYADRVEAYGKGVLVSLVEGIAVVRSGRKSLVAPVAAVRAV